MQLTEIPKYIQCKKIYIFNKEKFNFNYLYTNSKNVKHSSIFVVTNDYKKNRTYIKDAINNGAVGIITTKYFRNISVNQYLVEDIDFCIKKLLNNLFPQKPLKTIAITGTNGKTSVAWYLSQISILNKIPTKTYGTLGYFINNRKKNNSTLTTPNYEVLHQTAFSKNKNNYNFIFEASSHALDQNRLKNFPVNIAALTNITHDHLDYHKNIVNYKNVKFKLFIKYLDKKGFAILNENINNINSLKKKINKNIKVITYGKIKSDIVLIKKNNNVLFKFYKKKYILKNIDYNKFELENISCAIACCVGLNIEIGNIIKNLKKLTSPPGRLQNVINSKSYKIFVDYAHTPDALKQILLSQTYKKIKPNILFGCGGNRDKVKRSTMGYIANQYANRVYITDDNPREEDPALIRNHILTKCKKGIEISGRKKAIFRSIRDLKKKEILIIAGKGHEKFQIINNAIKIFDDVEMIKLAYKKK